jgi:hypothetical protein
MSDDEKDRLVGEVTAAGEVVGEVVVQIGPSFLQLFSEQMYTSPNKAFEELISNSWDAGATGVYVGLSGDLGQPGSIAWVLDNGESMDLEGLHLLWSVAHSTKRERTEGRPQIGKFGIGKLATYVLAHQLTYICRASDDAIRLVTMDYRRIEEAGGDLHIEPLPLRVRRLTEPELAEFLAGIEGGDAIRELIAAAVPPPEAPPGDSDEFGGADVEPSPPAGTWTLALLTDLRRVGQDIQVGRLRRMLRAALPLSSSIHVSLNGESLSSTKMDKEVMADWQVGPGLGIETIAVSGDEQVPLTEHSEPFPHITVPGLGVVSGTVRLFDERISGGKSESQGASNGFFLNILGRVVNADDPYFGLENLNHSSWSRFRAAVRADALDKGLSVNRQDVRESHELVVMRGLLRALFNKARNQYDSAQKAKWSDVGEILTKAWGAVPLDPLRRLIERAAADNNEVLPTVIDVGGVPDLDAVRADLAEDEARAIEDVEFTDDRAATDPLVSYDLSQRKVLLNRNHPFTIEHATNHEQQVLLRDAALVDFLTEIYLADLGVPPDSLEEAAVYRDQMLRLIARLRRRAPENLADLLDLVATQARPLELVVGDALESLGFAVTVKGGVGEPEGVARATVTAMTDGEAGTYSFTYDAKSTIHAKVRNNDVKVSTLARHRDDEKADHALVVAPDFESGALEEECAKNGITPMRIADLARLLMLNATHGPIDPWEFRQVFALSSPDAVATFIGELSEAHKAERRIGYGAFFDALGTIGYEEPDVLTASVIAREMRQQSGDSKFPTKEDVQSLVVGLSVLAPQLIRATGERIFLGAQPVTLRQAVLDTLKAMPPGYRFDLAEDGGS